LTIKIILLINIKKTLSIEVSRNEEAVIEEAYPATVPESTKYRV
jgi:hypothetical protein